MEITNVELQDLQQILEIEKRYFDGFEFYSLKSLNEMLDNKNVIFIKAVEKNKIVGYLIAYFVTDHIDLYQIAVDHNHLRQKIATKLEHCLSKHKLPIFIEVAESNTNAIAFYEANDYKIIKILNNYYESKNALLMRKETWKS